MAERQDSDREVLTSLPRTRPVRRSAKRGDRVKTDAGTASTPSRRPAAAKPGKAKAKATASARVKAPATTKAAPKATARSAPEATPRAARKATQATPPRRKVPPAGYAAPSGRDDAGGSGTADVISTTIQAAAELAQIGLTVGRQTLRSMLDRLPKP